MYVVESVRQVFETYMGATMFLPMFLVSAIYIFFQSDGAGRKRLLFVSALSILLVFNRVFLELARKVTDIRTFYRFLWAIPFLPVIAWAGTKVVMERKKFWKRAAVCVLLLALYKGGTSTFLVEGSVRVPENIYNLSEDVIQVCDIIEQHKSKEHPVVIFDIECQMRARLYNPSLVWGIRQVVYQNYNNTDDYKTVKKRYRAEKAMLHAVNYGVKGQARRLSRALKKKKVDYIVTLTSYEMDAYLERVGYELVDSTGIRSVYAKKQQDLEVEQ